MNKSVNADTDIQLVERAQRGDQKAFELLVIKYQRKLERLVSRMVKDHNLVPDIVQESLIKAYRALPGFRGDAQFYTWLYRIAVNTAKKTLLDIKKRPELAYSSYTSDQDGETNAKNETLIDMTTPDATLAAKEIVQTVEKAVEALPQELKQAILLREVDGLSYEEIAQAMDCPVGTVRSRIFRARDVIAAKLRPQLGTNQGQRW